MKNEKMQSDMDQKEIDKKVDELNGRLEDAGVDADEVLGAARKGLDNWNKYFNENQTRGRDDYNFAIKDQWTALERSEFTRLFKPAMQFNKIYDGAKKVLGEQRKNKPDLMVRSLTGKATQEEIDLRADLVRSISYRSQNDLVYQNAFKSALLMGYGAFEVCLDYETPYSFKQDIRYDAILDATRASFDPSAIKPHKGDGNFCARQYLYTKDEFFATYPWVTNPVSYSDPNSLVNFSWETKDTVIVCKYSQKEWFHVKILQLSNGMVVTEDEYEDLKKQFEIKKNLAESSIVLKDLIMKEVPEVNAERMSQDYIINQYLLTQNAVIDFTRWPSKYLPVVFVDGDSAYLNGQQYTRSFIHDAKDAQRFLNYVGCEIAAEIKNRRREQWLVTPDNITGYEQFWRNPELQTGALVAIPDSKTGMMPQKQSPWELSQSLMINFQRAGQDIREIMGFSEQQQLEGRDISGAARRERKIEGSMSAYVFFDNLNQAIEQGGRVVLDLLPAIATEENRPYNIKKPDGRTETIQLNRKLDDGKVENQIKAGDYDVEIDTGPSFAVQKEIALEFLQQTIAANPQAFPLVADLWAKNLDVQFMPQIVDRLKTMVPPQILAKEEGKELPPQPPSPQEQMMQMEMEDKQSQLKERAHELQIREEKHKLEKLKLIMDAKELEAKLNSDKQKNTLEANKAHMSYNAEIAKILVDLHKSTNKSE